ncbi:MAG: hypothetical protein WC506_01915 [Candidatus Micrarchaeia archaeon]
MAFIYDLLLSWSGVLSSIAPIISLMLITAGGIVYGLAQTQPSEVKGKWQTAAIGLVIGGLIVGAVWGSATAIRDNAAKLLT